MALLPLSATRMLPASSSVIPDGFLNSAFAPSTKPSCPVPAIVSTMPFSIFRIRLLPLSATKRVPSEAIATPTGFLKPDAKVVTEPSAAIFRIASLPLSATISVPSEARASPAGFLNPAAKVVTEPSGAIFRMALLPLSATKTSARLESIAIPCGSLNCACDAGPSV